MVIGLPRSGTTWAANWLSTDNLICIHDPLYTTHYSDWDTDTVRFPNNKGYTVGVSCTGIWRWPEWVNSHPAKKVILHRDYKEICKSMDEIGLPILERSAVKAIDEILGLHVPFTDLFDAKKAKEIWHYLTNEPFNEFRHKELVQIEMQPKFSGLSVGKEVTRKLMDELYAC